MNAYTVTPYDVLFFRGNVPFDFGQWYSEGVFPPLPSTYQGFVRSKMLLDGGFLNEKGKAFDAGKAKDHVGDDSALTVDIRGPFLIKDKTKLFLPIPRDLFQCEKQPEVYFSAFRSVSTDNPIESDLKFRLASIDVPDGKNKELDISFIDLDALNEYRLLLDCLHVPEVTLVETEDRVGIGLNSEKARNGQKIVEDSQFYVTPYNRFADDVKLYFSAEFENSEHCIKAGAFKLGSESHAVLVNETDDTETDLLEKSLSASRKKMIEHILAARTFRLLLLQPGIFEHGWMPFDFKPNAEEILGGNYLGVNLELLSAIVPSPLMISGYSHAKSGTSTMYKQTVKAAPAGSVYLFKIDENEKDEKKIAEMITSLDNQKIEFKHYHNMGFNHTVVACGPKPLNHEKQGE